MTSKRDDVLRKLVQGKLTSDDLHDPEVFNIVKEYLTERYPDLMSELSAKEALLNPRVLEAIEKSVRGSQQD